MTARRARPLLAIRIIGPADIVARQRAYLSAYLAKSLGGDGVTCRTSTHPARHTGETRVYITVSRRENN
jgi:hypothetical protein